MSSYYPAGALNDPRAPYNRVGGDCELLAAVAVGRDRSDGSLIYEDAQCLEEDTKECPTCNRRFCDKHAANDKRLAGCCECETDGTLFLCVICQKTVPDGDVHRGIGDVACVCQSCEPAD